MDYSPLPTATRPEDRTSHVNADLKYGALHTDIRPHLSAEGNWQLMQAPADHRQSFAAPHYAVTDTSNNVSHSERLEATIVEAGDDLLGSPL
jgi:hypothetical protein